MKESEWIKARRAIADSLKEVVYVGVDWAKDSGYNRSEVIKREGNVTHVRFKTVVINTKPNG